MCDESCRAMDSAMGLRQEFPIQTKRTRGFRLLCGASGRLVADIIFCELRAIFCAFAISVLKSATALKLNYCWNDC